MKFLFCLFALLGVACGLKANYEYEYQYRGAVATGIPGIRPQVSGTGIKAKLVLQMETNQKGYAQLKNIQVGQYHDDLKDEHLRIPLPIQYSPLSQYSNQLEKPFAVYFDNQMGHVMDVDSQDAEWMTNIRKSIIQMIHFERLSDESSSIISKLRERSQAQERSQKGQERKQFPAVLSAEEETIFGRCESQYTITPLRHYLREETEREVERHLRKDEQSDEMQQEYYQMVRAIDFSKCHDKVILQFASAGNMSQIGSAQFNSVQSRSSVGTYILKLSSESFRVESAKVDGSIIVNPYGIETDKLQSRTNQTLFLNSVSKKSPDLKVQSPAKVETWRYTVVSPFSEPSYKKPWIKFQSLTDKYFPIPPSYTLLGMKPSSQLISEWKQTVLQLIKEVAQQIREIPDLPSKIPPMSSLSENMGYVLTYKLFEASRLLKALEVQQVRDIFSQIFSDNSQKGQIAQALLFDAVAASGAAAPYKALLEEMKKGKISDSRMFSLFPPLTIHVSSPIIVEELMSFVMSLNPETHPFLTASAYNGFPNLLRRICMNHNTFNYSLPNDLFGTEVCDAKLVTEKFIPHLEEKLKSASRFYEKAIYVQALTLIGSPHVLPILRPIIRGESKQNARLRIIAINGLVKDKMPETYKNKVFDILMGLVDQLDEESIVRQAAFISLLTWHPSPAWWQRMAHSTWREPSRQMAAFIAVTMESLSKATGPSLRQQADYARFALRMAKPMTPSFKYAYNFIYDQYDPKINMATFATVEWLMNKRSSIPPVMWSTQTQSFGGMELNWGDFGLSQEGLSQVIKEATKLVKGHVSESEQEYYKQGGARSRQNRRGSASVAEWLERKMAQEVGSLEQLGSLNQLDALLFVRGWSNIRNMYPINSHTLSTLFTPDLMSKLRNGMRVNITKFFNSAENEYFIPTEIGLPVIGSVSRPVLLVSQGTVQLNSRQNPLAPSSRTYEVDFKTNTKKISKILVKLRVLVPWNQKEIETGVSQAHEYNMPVYGKLSAFGGKYLGNASINIAPYSDKKIPLIYVHNVPYTAIKTFVPTKNEQYKVITVRDNEVPVYQLPYEFDPRVYGVKAVAKYYGDAEVPFQTGKTLEYLANPSKMMSLLVSPTVKLYQASFVIDPSQSPAKNVSMSFSYLSVPNSPESQREESEALEYLRKVTPEALKLYKEKRSQEYQEKHLYNVKLYLNSTDFHRVSDLVYMSQMKVVGDAQNKVNKYKIDATAFSSYCPFARQSAGIFLDLVYQTPNITTKEDLKQKLSQSLKEQYHGTIKYASPLDNNKQLISFSGENLVTSQRRNIVLRKLETLTDSDSYDPTVQLSPAAVYDQGSFEMEVQQRIPIHLANFTSQIEKTIQGFMFPSISINDIQVNNAQNTYKLSYFRPISSAYYHVFVTKPKENVSIRDIYVPYMINTIVPSKGLQEQQVRESRRFESERSSRFDSERSSVCEISAPHQKITTFDGVQMKYDLPSCYTTVLKRLNTNIFSPSYYEVFSRIYQKNLYMKLEFHERKVVEFSNTKIWINGVIQNPQLNREIRVPDSRNNLLMKIVRTDSTHMLATIYSGNEQESLIIKADQERAHLIPVDSKDLHDQVRGICGDYDGLTKYDKTGPQTCIFTNDNLFEYSWATPDGHQCDVSTLKQKMKEVAEFREHCEHRPAQAHNTISFNRDGYDFIYVYPIVQTTDRKPYICMPFSPVQKCAQGTVLEKYHTITRNSKCWDEKSVPKVIKTMMEEVGYLLHPVKLPYQRQLEVSYKEATVCRVL